MSGMFSPHHNNPLQHRVTDRGKNKSNIRQIPDNQEVYLDSDGFSSVVVELMERVDLPDDEALEYHLRDLVEDEEDDAAEKTRVWERGAGASGKMP